MTINVAIKGCPGRAASVVERKDGVIHTNLWGEDSWWRITDPLVAARAREVRRMPNSADHEFWKQLAAHGDVARIAVKACWDGSK